MVVNTANNCKKFTIVAVNVKQMTKYVKFAVQTATFTAHFCRNKFAANYNKTTQNLDVYW